MKKLFPFVLLILLLIGAVATVPFLLQSDKRRLQLADQLSQLLHRKVVIGKMEMSLFPPSFKLGEVAVFSPDQSAPDLQITSLHVGVGLGDLFTGRFHPESLSFDQWSFSFHRVASGRWDVSNWLDSFAHGGAGNVAALRQVAFKNGTIHWLDSFSETPAEFVNSAVEGTWDVAHQTTHASASLTGGPVPIALTFQGQGRFFSAVWTGDLHAAAEGRQSTAHLDGSPGHLGIKADAAQWRWDSALGLAKFIGRMPIPLAAAPANALLQNWHVDYSAAGDSSSVTTSASLGGGALQVTLLAAPQTGALALQGGASAKDVPLQVLCEPVGGCFSLDGKLTATLPHFAFIASSQAWSTAQGSATVEIREGRYHLPELSVQKLHRAHLLKYMKQKFTGFPEQGFVFTLLKARVGLAAGSASVPGASVDAGDVRLSLVGKMNPAHRAVDATLRLLISASGGSLSLIPGKYISGSTGHERIQPIFGHLQGTLEEWSLRAVPAYKIPAPVKAQLQKALS